MTRELSFLLSHPVVAAVTPQLESSFQPSQSQAAALAPGTARPALSEGSSLLAPSLQSYLHVVNSLISERNIRVF